ncbi:MULTISPECIES: small acid-soluble spore protein P [Paenibacillus]|uniref:Small acid-soluble spore protein P n=1 Tax=Paenibacillus terrae TaxID=159743 RepID=A0A4U2PZW7_9BACL|nr:MULTISPECIES: small acid-soluble spore protein P [Paenibacillus]TKH45363.1 small acid-soluble spore protein P [Paenibacillus terrae]
MSKPKAIPVPEAQDAGEGNEKRERNHQQEPLSGSKKVKQRNHVDHHNREGS